jgi:streptomycin 3"-kinase
LAAECDRITWLSETDIPTASVLDWHVGDEGACLVTRAVDGIPADQLDAPTLQQAWLNIAEVVRHLHNLPVESCPFDRGLDVMVSRAHATVAKNRVNAEFLPAEVRGIPATTIFSKLHEELAQRRREERQSRVICHGDLCLPNIVIDTETFDVSGLIDLGRLGCADPYADIALLLNNARATWPGEITARTADDDFARHYGIELDDHRQRFYLLLDPLTWPVGLMCDTADTAFESVES